MDIVCQARAILVRGHKLKYFPGEIKKNMIPQLTVRNYVSPPKVRGDIFVSVRILGIGVVWQFGIHHISWINLWNFTRLAWVHHWDKLKSWFSFGDSDPIFKVTGGLRLLNFLRQRRCQRGRFLYPGYLLNQCMECHQTCMDILFGQA